jgi:hypothetical protein
MHIVEFDGTDVTFENVEPLWTLDEVFNLGQERLARVLEDHGHHVEWEDRPVYEFLLDQHVTRRCVTHETAAAVDELPRDARYALLFEGAADYRERLGMRRSDGKRLQRTTRKAPLDRLADEHGIATNELGWEEATLEVIRHAPARGRINPQ